MDKGYDGYKIIKYAIDSVATLFKLKLKQKQKQIKMTTNGQVERKIKEWKSEEKNSPKKGWKKPCKL